MQEKQLSQQETCNKNRSQSFSKNQGLEKSRSVSNLRKMSGPGNLDFFLGVDLEKKLDLYHKPEKNPGDKLKKKPQVCRT